MKERFRSLDVFRGAAVALMILVNNPGSWDHLYPPLAHATWHGCTPTDLVFPFFLFAVGNALALVMPALRAGPAPAFWAHVARRTLLIFAIGLFLNAAPFVRWDAGGELVLRHWDTLRLMGVLQRIALCFGAAAAIVWVFGRRGAPWVAAALLLAYWAVCLTFGAPGDPYSLPGWFGTAVDRALLGAAHLYRGEGVPFDPEGLASTAPAIAQVLLGWWVGQMIVGGRLDSELLARLFLWATLLLVTAYAWQLAMPLNKKIWTSSYVLFTSGLAMMALAVCIHLVDIRRRPAELRGWAAFFEVFGRNPLFIFVLSGFVPRVLALLRWQDGVGPEGAPLWTSPLPWVHQNVFAGLGGDPRLGSLLFAVANLLLYWLLAWWLDRRRIYIRV
ncbi:MAG: heparan-alpha-glucosaminide N-acetyltransferase domain-containing protein [Rubrivivax sp.]|nr:heparan-alpha-glucosaminide N-acetyltransferase domain-containing protein [Rubrivivax sp.]